ncbi:hypothetical protein QBC40DRAFT_248785 [Triangularia verruculosa]|uniref:Uncharacterized protein n=1 Tax=Triangularia verruculosa TaxID=2587418 RepID=A0AAN6XS85_9PEZI|nr:hypothetical protein QBC40DRAFT_248785 [Triangularia verruculosa]
MAKQYFSPYAPRTPRSPRLVLIWLSCFFFLVWVVWYFSGRSFDDRVAAANSRMQFRQDGDDDA